MRDSCRGEGSAGHAGEKGQAHQRRHPGERLGAGMAPWGAMATAFGSPVPVPCSIFPPSHIFFSFFEKPQFLWKSTSDAAVRALGLIPLPDVSGVWAPGCPSLCLWSMGLMFGGHISGGP